MPATTDPVVVTSIKLDIAELIKKERDALTRQGQSHGEAIGHIAKAMGKTPAFVYAHLSIMELPTAILSLMRHKPVAVGFAMKVWKETKGDIEKSKKILLSALANAEMVGARKAMPKHLEYLRSLN